MAIHSEGCSAFHIFYCYDYLRRALFFPGVQRPTMDIDWVRLHQNPARHTTGCDPPGYPSTKYIEKNANKFGTSPMPSVKGQVPRGALWGPNRAQ
jgi:hypothetical protein